MRKHIAWTTAAIGTLTCLAGYSSIAQADVIASWNFNSTLSASSTASDVTATGPSSTAAGAVLALVVPGSNTQESGTSISGTTLSVKGFAEYISAYSMDLTTVPTNSNYFSIVTTAASGSTIDFSSLSFDFSLISTRRGFAITYIADNGTETLLESGNDTFNGNSNGGSVNNNYQHHDYTLSLNDVSQLEIRFYIYAYNANTYEMKFDNITLTGDVSNVPEAASLSMLAIGGSLLLARRRA